MQFFPLNSFENFLCCEWPKNLYSSYCFLDIKGLKCWIFILYLCFCASLHQYVINYHRRMCFYTSLHQYAFCYHRRMCFCTSLHQYVFCYHRRMCFCTSLHQYVFCYHRRMCFCTSLHQFVHVYSITTNCTLTILK
jgi:hypothetical protein